MPQPKASAAARSTSSDDAARAELIHVLALLGVAVPVDEEGPPLVDALRELVNDALDRRPLVADTPDARLVAALAAAQAAFPPIAKTKTAQVRSEKGSYSYAYADLADVLAVVRPVLALHGLAVIQRTQYLANGALMLYTELRHVAGGAVASEVLLDAKPSSPQAFGGALTYLRRYELVTLLGIQADEDADAHNVAAPDDRRDAPTTPAPPPPPPWAEPAGRATVNALGAELERLVGEEAAGTLVNGIRRYADDNVPRVATRALLGLLTRLEDAGIVEAPPEATAAAQDAAADRPDQPAPEPGADPPATLPLDEDEPPIANVLRSRPAAEVEAAAKSHPDDEVRAAAARELEFRAGRGPDPLAAEATTPTPGTVDVGELPADRARATGILKAAGCICPDPLALKSEHGELEDACPVKGHGIPF